MFLTSLFIGSDLIETGHFKIEEELSLKVSRKICTPSIDKRLYPAGSESLLCRLFLYKITPITKTIIPKPPPKAIRTSVATKGGSF